MKHIKTIILVIVFSLLYSSCKENDRFRVERGEITNVSGPTSGAVGENMVFAISFFAYNGCGRFHNIKSNLVENTVYIEANVKYIGSICPEVLVEFQEDFVFRPTEQGVFTLVFQNNVQEHITLTITIN